MVTGNNATKDVSPATFGQPGTMLKRVADIANCFLYRMREMYEIIFCWQPVDMTVFNTKW